MQFIISHKCSTSNAITFGEATRPHTVITIEERNRFMRKPPFQASHMRPISAYFRYRIEKRLWLEPIKSSFTSFHLGYLQLLRKKLTTFAGEGNCCATFSVGRAQRKLHGSLAKEYTFLQNSYRVPKQDKNILFSKSCERYRKASLDETQDWRLPKKSQVRETVWAPRLPLGSILKAEAICGI